MRDLERELRALEAEWPPTPDLAAFVTARIERAPRVAGVRRRAWGKRAAAALLVLLGGGLAVSPAARSALGDLLGLRGAEVRRVPVPAHPTPHPGRLGSGLRLGRAVTLGQAGHGLRFRITLPPRLGAPDAVWLAESRGQPTRVSLIYGRRPGIPVSPHTNVAVLLTEFRATVTPVLDKALGAGARLSRIRVPGARAYAITGRPHGFAWVGADGQANFEDRRLAGTTLLVERDDGVLLRAEGELPRTLARRLARELARG
jgi:hypothetical protein